VTDRWRANLSPTPIDSGVDILSQLADLSLIVVVTLLPPLALDIEGGGRTGSGPWRV